MIVMHIYSFSFELDVDVVKNLKYCKQAKLPEQIVMTLYNV